MAYNKHDWSAGEAITAPKMNTLETAVLDVAALADKLVADTGKTDVNKPSLLAQIDTANSSITTINNSISDLGTMREDISTAKLGASAALAWINTTGTTINNDINGTGGLKASVADLKTLAADGANAWAQISPVVGYTSLGITTPLTDVLLTIRNSVTEVNTALNKEVGDRTSADTTILTLIDNAVGTTYYGTTAPANLQEKILNIQAEINNKAPNGDYTETKTKVNSIETDIKNATTNHTGRSYTSLTNRLDTEEEAFNSLLKEVTDARGDSVDLDARLDAIEAAATTAALDNDNAYVKKSQIKDSLDINTSGNVLDARQGKILNDDITKIKTALNGFIDTKTVQSEIDDTESALLNWVNGKIVDSDTINTVVSPSDSTNITSAKVGKELYSELSNARISQAIRTPGQNEGDPDTDTTYNSLDERLEAIEGRANTASDAFEQLLAEILAAHESNVKGTEDSETHEVTPLEYGSLDARFEAAEGDIHKIASELKMYNQAGAIQDATTRIDTIEKNVLEMGKEIGMINDLETVQTLSDTIDRASTYIDNIKSEIGAAHRTNEDTLSARFGAVESSVSGLNSTITNAETGLVKTKKIADEALGKANAAAVATEVTSALAGKASTESVEDLSDRVTTLEQSGTVVIDNVTYDNDGNPSNIGITPSPNVDYLLKKGDKYYYWKYIPNNTDPVTYTWALISGGATEGGGGTSSALIVATLPEAEAADVNTDYYVGNNDDGYVHYRFIPTIVEEEETLVAIPVGNYVDTNQIKLYRLVLRDIPVSTGSEETNPWLFLYKFNYGENTDIESGEDFTSPVWTTRLVDSFLLPSGGGSSTPTTLIKVTRITPRAITAVQNSTDRKTYIRFFFTDGEGGDTYYYSLSLNGREIVSRSEATKITSGDPINKSSTWPTVVDSETGETVLQDPTKVPTGFYAIDITPYCILLGLNLPLIVTITNADNEYILSSTTWDLSVILFNLTSSSADGLIVSCNENVTLKYTPYGAVEKTLYVEVGDNVYTRNLPVSAMGREYEIVIPANSQSHGAHVIKMYMTTTINNGTEVLPTDPIYKEYIWYDAEDEYASSVIIASPKSVETSVVDSYTNIEIPYSVYHKEAEDYTIYYYLNYGTTSEKLIGSVSANDNYNGKIVYAPITSETKENLTITIKVEDTTLDIPLEVHAIKADVAPILGAIIDFDPTSLTNDSINRLPSWTIGTGSNAVTYSLTASDNFNWSNDISGGGYKEDVDGKCFVIKAGSYVDLNYPMFSNNNLFAQGAEMKIIFKIGAVRNIKAVWYSNTGTVTDKEVGIQLGAHSGWLKTDKAADTTVNVEPDENGILTINDTSYTIWKPETHYAVDDIVLLYDKSDEDNHMILFKCIKEHDSGTQFLNAKGKVDDKLWLASGKVDTEILATNSYLYMPYSEEDKIELDININAYDAKSNNNFIMSYEDGVPSKVYSYKYGNAGDNIRHSNTIHIGSPDCDVYIYRLRFYNHSLDTSDVLLNFIADGQTIQEKLTRYKRNCVYWNGESGEYELTKTESNSLDPVKLAELMPNVKILMLDTPVFTVGKKNYVMNSTLRCIHAIAPEDYEGNIYYASRGDADNWFFLNGFHSGQGTTSDNYGQSGRNVDFLFEVDGENWPAVEKDISKTYDKANNANYISNVLIGQNASTWEPVVEGDNEGIHHWVPARDPEESEICHNWKGDDCKISLTEHSVPNNYFNLKVNVASSENVNNALFLKRYDDFIKRAYNSPATAALKAKHANTYANINDITVKNSMEFVPAVLFVRENLVDEQGNPVGHTEFNDCDWHFYALGNIGDSKKTDYTRAYNPDDMNEFTCENSDNNTNNGLFQSGIFMYRNQRAIETPYNNFSVSIAYKSGTKVINNGKIYIRTGADETTGAEWNTTDWEEATLTNWTDSETPYFAPFTAPNTMEYLYPISSSEWNVLVGSEWVNYKHNTLVNEKFDGDHSWEFRYACQGDYRDGKLINPSENDTDPEKVARYNENMAQERLNHEVMLAFYEWLLTSTPLQYKDEAELWFVKPAMEFFYAYTHYYTMMDNRAKNTFWHFAQTGTWKKVPIGRAVPALFHVYEVDDDNGGHRKIGETEVFDNTKQYWTQYAFDLWAYDMDTAAGIDNNGALVFPYGKEDTDYRTENDSASGYAFNGAGSIFWRRLRTEFADEITTIMDSADANCFNSENLITEFDHFLECFPEEIWRLDIERKYIRTFTGLSIDNSVTTGKLNPRFLTSMMQGRKKYQRRQWIRDLGVYFNSKYRLTDIIRNENTVEFNCTTPAIPEWSTGTSYTVGQKVFYAPEIEGLEINRRVYRCIRANNDTTFDTTKWVEDVTPTYHLSLVPYQDMYLNVLVGNGNYQESYVTVGEPTLRAKAGEEYIFDITGNYQETRIYINGANHLAAIGNLAPMYPYSFDLRALAHIKTLDIGTDDAGYVNTKFTELKLPLYIPLLETLNIKNCHSLAGTIELDTANNIRTIEALGTAITGISLPKYTSLETLHIPSTMTSLDLYGARFLSDFAVYNSAGNIDYSTLYKIHIYDSDYSENINWLDIARVIVNKKSLETELSLLKLSTSSINNIEDLATLGDFKPILEQEDTGILELSGIINVTDSWSEIEAKKYANTTNVLTYDSETGTYNTTQVITSTTGIWPDLTLNARGTKTTKFAITYKYDSYVNDEGDIVEGDIITTLYITSGVRIPDIYNTGVIEMPTRNSTVRNNYTFGERSFGNYIVNSGWKAENSDADSYFTTMPLATSNMVIETHFRSEVRRYPVKWYMHRNDPDSLVKTSTSNVEYGSGESLEAPTIPEIHAAGLVTYTVSIANDIATYSIFTGWETLPINIHPSATDDAYNIYATWETASVSLGDLFADTSNLTPEQLLVYSHMNSTLRNNYANSTKIGAGQRITYTLGLDSIETGTTLVDSSNILRFDLNASLAPVKTNILPMTSTNNEFTIMIDYSFNPDAVYENTDNAGVLMSCYYLDSAANVVSGFALYNNLNSNLGSLGPRVGFGDMFNSSAYSVSVGANGNGNYNTRNIVVLRHPKDSTVLYVYSGFSGDNHINSTVNVLPITWNNSTSNAYINFGQLTDDTSSEYDNLKDVIKKASGTIYQAKYWNKDLGVGECKRLAAWPHELVTFGITNIANTVSTGSPADTSSVPAVGLTTLTTSNHGLFAEDTAAVGWGSSTYNTIVNNGVILGLPTKLQAILSKPSIKYLTIVSSENNGITIKTLSTTASSLRNYLYFPSVVNIDSSTNSKYGAEIVNINYEAAPFPWINGGNVTIYEYNPTDDGHWTQVSDSNAGRYMNLRFPMKPVNNTVRIFRENSSTFSTGNSTNIYTEIIAKVNEINTGDIFIDINGHAYMYVSDSDVMALGVQVQAPTGIFTASAGGWVPSIGFWTRSMMEADTYSSYSNANHFVYSSLTGVVVTSYSSSTAAPSSGLGLNYSISI